METSVSIAIPYDVSLMLLCIESNFMCILWIPLNYYLEVLAAALKWSGVLLKLSVVYKCIVADLHLESNESVELSAASSIMIKTTHLCPGILRYVSHF